MNLRITALLYRFSTQPYYKHCQGTFTRINKMDLQGVKRLHFTVMYSQKIYLIFIDLTLFTFCFFKLELERKRKKKKNIDSTVLAF